MPSASSAIVKMRVGLDHADFAGVDHALHRDADARADLEHFLLPQPRRDGAVGVRDDTEPDSGGVEDAQVVDRSRDDPRPHRGGRELGVQVLEHVGAQGVGHVELGHVGREVAVPHVRPRQLTGVVGAERDRAAVVRAVEPVERGVEAAALARAQYMLVAREVEDAADVEEDGFDGGHGGRIYRLASD